MRRALKWLAAALIASAGGLVICGLTYEPQAEPPEGLQGQFAEIMGLRTRYLQVGHGPDVLLIHGSTGSLEDWAAVRDALAADFRVTTFDRPGHGYTATGLCYDPVYNADFASALIHTLHLERPVVAGHSYGGSTAMALALQHPADARSYVVVDSAVYVQVNKPDPIYRLLVVPGFGTGVARLAAGSIAPKKIRRSVEGLFGTAVVPAGFVEARIPIWSQPKVTVSVAHEWLEAQDNLDAISPRYGEIRQPVFIIGQGDQPLRRQNAERLHRDIAGSELQLVNGAGHFIQLTRTDAVVGMIRKATAAQKAGRNIQASPGGT